MIYIPALHDAESLR